MHSKEHTYHTQWELQTISNASTLARLTTLWGTSTAQFTQGIMPRLLTIESLALHANLVQFVSLLDLRVLCQPPVILNQLFGLGDVLNHILPRPSILSQIHPILHPHPCID